LRLSGIKRNSAWRISKARGPTDRADQGRPEAALVLVHPHVSLLSLTELG
jgi:hypothetical protein